MRSRFLTRSWLHWTMAFIVWFGALAPVVSQAAQSLGWAMPDEVCSVMPTATGSSSDNGDRGDARAVHCPFCLLQAHAPVLPPGDDTIAWHDPGRVHEVPRLFLQAPHTLPVWVQAQPRAPPLNG